jgi:hypothetical protein
MAASALSGREKRHFRLHVRIDRGNNQTDYLFTKMKYYHILKHCFGISRNSLDLGFLQIFNGKTVPVCQGVDLGFGAKF